MGTSNGEPGSLVGAESAMARSNGEHLNAEHGLRMPWSRTERPLADTTKKGVLTASFVAGAIGYAVPRRAADAGAVRR
jgi:hypothetical protein